MKTYLFDTINRVQRFSQKLDVTTTLCNKTWVVFNDSGERELYIFQPDGSVFITNNGIGIIGHWQWIATNKSLVIHSNGGAIMLHPQYIDDVILALNLDGTNETAFLIEEKNHESFAPKTLTQLHNYFFNKEQKLIASQQEAEKERRRLIAEQEQRQWEEEMKRREIAQLKIRANQILQSLNNSNSDFNSSTFIIIGALLGLILGLILPMTIEKKVVGCICLSIGCAISFPIIACSFYSNKQEKDIFNKINNWKQNHPNDPVCNYLRPYYWPDNELK